MEIQRYTAADLPTLFDKITKNSIGMDSYFDSFWNTTQTNYPPYNLIHVSNEESRLEIAIAGFKKDDVKVYTEFGKIYVEAVKEEQEDVGEFVHQGLARRSFQRAWTLSDDTEIRSVSFDDGLLSIVLGKVVPDHHKRVDYI
jgi:HSP20 family molecular chaperone IbpA